MATKKRKPGRPPTDADKRDTKLTAYLTKADVDQLDRIADVLNFKSRSALISALLERLLIGGFSMRVFLQLGIQIARRAAKVGKVVDHEFYFGVRPLPPFPDEDLRAEELEVLEQLKTEIEEPC